MQAARSTALVDSSYPEPLGLRGARSDQGVLARALVKPMNASDIFDSVELARDRLVALHERLARQAGGSVPEGVLEGLRQLSGLMPTLRTRYELLVQVLDRTNDMISVKDLQGRYEMINSTGALLFALPADEVVGLDDRDLFDAKDSETVMALDQEVMRSGVPQTSEDVLELRGVPHTLITSRTPWYDPVKRIRGVIGVGQDVTDRRSLERDQAKRSERLSGLALANLLEEERLRRTLAAELHDGIGQDVNLAKLRLATLREATTPELHASLNGIIQLMEVIDGSLRGITYRISPPSLHDLGFVEALHWLVESMAAQHQFEVDFEVVEPVVVMDEWARVILFRAVRELLSNVLLHARVLRARLRIERRGTDVLITVSDLGLGFDAADFDQHGYGLFGIREQCRYIGATLTVQSEPGAGTTVVLCAPVAKRGDDGEQ